MMAARARNDITEATEAHDRIEPTPRKLPTDANDSAEPTDRIDPTEPMDRIEPAELIDRIESVELIDHRALPPGSSTPTSLARRGTAVILGSGRVRQVFVTALPAGSTTYQRPPALVSAWPVAVPGAWSGGHR